jgi:NAD(P)-dependent dehydrogenase (short-subunit alcohol dehydrogenase family)
MALTGRVALVTGGSRGIGRAICLALAEDGADVAVNYRRDDAAASKTVAAIEALGRKARAYQASVDDFDALAVMVAGAEKELGPIDILVNNAAYGPYRPTLEFSAEDFTKTLGMNMFAALDLSQRVLPGMLERGRGWIVNISSATVKLPDGPPYMAWEQLGGHHLYGASKSGLDRLTVGMAAELHGKGVAINTLAPVAAVMTPGVYAKGIADFIEDSMKEPVETMAEAALLLSTCDPEKLTGRVTYSGDLLAEFGRELRALDGSPF